ncbi:amidase signature enzyme [Hortaea werneckii]|nr:amidase signature enzyme [Hortaea werneckii]
MIHLPAVVNHPYSAIFRQKVYDFLLLLSTQNRLAAMSFLPSFLSILNLAALVVLPVATSSSSPLVDNGTVVTLGGVPYYSGGISVATLSVASGHKLQTLAPLDSDVFPMTVIRTNNSAFSISELNNTISSFNDTDDVFTRDFLTSVFLDYLGAGPFRPSIAEETTGYPQNISEPWPTLMTAEEGTGLTSASLSCSLPNGPYFVSARTGAVFKAHRLYPDDYLNFIQGIISDEAGGYLSLPAVTENVMAKSVAVPSKLYSTVTPEKPLAGLRLGVKDIYHVKGIKTSGGNRAYFYLYEAQNVTAPADQRLIDQGAILVGKMGTVQFANGDSSSAGPGAGIGAYDWLDIAVGSDTGGSMRGAAGAQGIYGNRPSTGAVSMEHVIPLTPTLDTAGVFARSASLWSTVAHAYTSQEPESFLNVNRTQVDVTQRWDSTHPTDASSNVTEMLHDTYGVLTSTTKQPTTVASSGAGGKRKATGVTTPRLAQKESSSTRGRWARRTTETRTWILRPSRPSALPTGLLLATPLAGNLLSQLERFLIKVGSLTRRSVCQYLTRSTSCFQSFCATLPPMLIVMSPKSPDLSPLLSKNVFVGRQPSYV